MKWNNINLGIKFEKILLIIKNNNQNNEKKMYYIQ